MGNGGSGGSGRRVGGTVQPCQQRHIEGWYDDQAEASSAVKCGDRLILVANSTDIPAGTAVTFRLKQCPADGRPVETLRAVLEEVPRGAQVDKEWICRKSFRGWDNNCVNFQVSGGGATADSMNERTFHRYADIPSETKTYPRNVTNDGIRFGWTGKYDIAFTNFEVVVTVKIKLNNRQGPQPARGVAPPAIGPAVDDQTKARIKRSAEGILSQRWVLHRDNCRRGARCGCNINNQCCKFKVRVDVQFVEAGAHHTVDLFQGRNAYTVNSSEWGRVPWDNLDYGHEIGHLLGWYDEYNRPGARGAIAPAANRPPWQENRNGAIMHCSGRAVPKFYYDDFKNWFNSKTREPWELIR